MRIAIASTVGTPVAIEAWRPTALVSITSPRYPLAWPYTGPTLSLILQDMETPRHFGPTHRPLPGGAIVAQPDHLTSLWAFMERHALEHARGLHRSHASAHEASHGPAHAAHDGAHGIAHHRAHAPPHEAHDGGEPRLLIQCTAGLGRSPAMAIVAAIIEGHDAATACAMVAHASPHASPNRLILRHAERMMGVNIVSHAERQFTYRRGPSGALGEAILWGEIGVGTPHPGYGSSLEGA